MIAFLVPAAVVCVVFIIVMKEAGFPAHRTQWIGPLARPTNLPLSRLRAVRCKLMTTNQAEMFLIPVQVFAIAIKVLIVVAFRTSKLVYFCHENSSPFREVQCFVVKPLYQIG